MSQTAGHRETRCLIPLTAPIHLGIGATMTDSGIDLWMVANSKVGPISDLGYKRLHALGVIALRWNRAEQWLFTIFCDVSGYDEAEAWAMVFDLGDISICERIKSLLKIRGFTTEAPLIENAIEFYDICRGNRNS